MLVKSRRDNYASLYQWLTTSETGEDGVTTTVPVEFADEEALDEKVEAMLNDEGYAKSDFIVVKYIDYKIEATDYNIE
ncbi:MAG: hypothetical protein IJ640_06650 [Prevotella sp.]|nr:hypothetical protein [Prevotella sp.]